MTNGEKIKEIFPDSHINEMSHTVWVGYEAMSFRRDWWSAEYKEPTTKNEAKYCDRNICLKNEYNNVGCENCEVTKSQESTQSPIIDWNNCHTSKQLDSISITKNDLEVDLISRKAVIDELKRYFHDEYYQRTSIQDCRDCFIEDVLNHLPSVTPQEPRWIHAKWEQLDNEPDTFFTTHQYECSNCGKIQLAKSKNIKKYRYCSKCGANMREVEE